MTKGERRRRKAHLSNTRSNCVNNNYARCILSDFGEIKKKQNKTTANEERVWQNKRK